MLAHKEAMVLHLVGLTCIRIKPAQPSPSPPPSPLIQVLHLVDFDQLKIENQQYLEKIEERNQDLLRLKLSTSRTVQVRGERGRQGQQCRREEGAGGEGRRAARMNEGEGDRTEQVEGGVLTTHTSHSHPPPLFVHTLSPFIPQSAPCRSSTISRAP